MLSIPYWQNILRCFMRKALKISYFIYVDNETIYEIKKTLILENFQSNQNRQTSTDEKISLTITRFI